MSLSLGIVLDPEITVLTDLTPLLCGPDCTPTDSAIEHPPAPAMAPTPNAGAAGYHSHQTDERPEVGDELCATLLLFAAGQPARCITRGRGREAQKKSQDGCGKFANFAEKQVRPPPKACVDGCRKRCTNSFCESQRKKINEQVNKLSLTARRQWYRSFVEEHEVKERRGEHKNRLKEHKKTKTFQWSLPNENRCKIVLCKGFFPRYAGIHSDQCCTSCGYSPSRSMLRTRHEWRTHAGEQGGCRYDQESHPEIPPD